MVEVKGVILTVDDEIEARGMLVDYLEVRGYTMLSASGAADAIRLLELHPETDLLLTDIVMPGGMSGYDLAERAEQVRPGIRVMFMTGHARARMIGEAMRPPPIILLKPLWLEHLAQIVAADFAANQTEGD